MPSLESLASQFYPGEEWRNFGGHWAYEALGLETRVLIFEAL